MGAGAQIPDGASSSALSTASQVEGASSPSLPTSGGRQSRFAKTLAPRLQSLRATQPQSQRFQHCRYWVEDESRFGLKTMPARRITLKGIKPIGEYQWQFESLWLYGAIEPASGESLFWQYSHGDSDYFEHFLRALSQQFPESFHGVQVDHGGLHKAQKLNIPANVELVFQPPYTPEVNPAERVWQALKRPLKWRRFASLEPLSQVMAEQLESLSPQRLQSLAGYPFILDALSVAQFI